MRRRSRARSLPLMDECCSPAKPFATDRMSGNRPAARRSAPSGDTAPMSLLTGAPTIFIASRIIVLDRWAQPARLRQLSLLAGRIARGAARPPDRSHSPQHLRRRDATRSSSTTIAPPPSMNWPLLRRCLWQGTQRIRDSRRCAERSHQTARRWRHSSGGRHGLRAPTVPARTSPTRRTGRTKS